MCHVDGIVVCALKPAITRIAKKGYDTGRFELDVHTSIAPSLENPRSEGNIISGEG